MGEFFSIGVSEGGRVCACEEFASGGFCVESFTLSQMGDKLPNGEENFPIYGMYGAIEKQ